MATLEISPSRIESILSELEALPAGGRPRPFTVSSEDGESDLAQYAPVDIRQCGDALQIEVALAGVAPQGLHVRLAPTNMLIMSDACGHSRSPHDIVHLREFQTGCVCQSIHLPAAIDPRSARAVYRHGLLRVTAAIRQLGVRRDDTSASDALGRPM